MKQILNKIFVLILVFMAFSANAQSLQELINIALANNYQIRILRNEAQIASNSNTIGNAGMLPVVNLNSAYSTSLTNTQQVFADGTSREGSNARNTNINLSVLANWTVFGGLRVYAKRDQLNYLEELGQVNSKFYIEQTVSDIAMAYCQLIYEKQTLKNFQESLSISAFRLNMEKKRKAVGVGKTIDYGQALVDYQTDSIRFLEQKNTVQLIEIELNRILNNDLEKELIVQDEAFLVEPIFSKDSLFNLLENNNRQLEQKRLQELIAETDLRMAKAGRYPKVDVFAGYEHSASFSEVGFFSRNQNFGPILGASISFNLFNGGATNLNIKNTEIYSENSQLSKEQINQTINADALKLYYQYLSLNERIALTENNVETMKGVYETAKEQLEKGAINGFDFRLTQLSLLNSELGLMQLQFALKAVEINLNRLSGKVLDAYL